MNILIVHAHENPDSFCSALCSQAEKAALNKGHSVIVSDLYLQEFIPTGGKHDFTKLSDASYYKYATEQLHASNNDGFSPELKAEMNKLIEADLLIFNFPLWWYDMPAILKGWVDRVMAYGIAYGGKYGWGQNGRFKGRKALATVTTGTPTTEYQKPIAQILDNLNSGIFRLVGYEVIDPFVASAVSRITKEERVKILDDYENFLLQQL